MNTTTPAVVDKAAQWEAVARAAGAVASTAIQIIRVCANNGLAVPHREPEAFGAAMKHYLTAIDVPFEGDVEKSTDWLATVDKDAQAEAYEDDELLVKEIAAINAEEQ